MTNAEGRIARLLARRLVIYYGISYRCSCTSAAIRVVQFLKKGIPDPIHHIPIPPDSQSADDDLLSYRHCQQLGQQGPEERCRNSEQQQEGQHYESVSF